MTPRKWFLCSVGCFFSCCGHTAGEAQDALFRRGDANADGRTDISDGLATLNVLFLDGDLLPCEDAADVDDSGRLQVSDAVFGLNFLFLRGSVPPAPGPVRCGVDPTEDLLGCASYGEEEGATGCSPPVPSGALFETPYFSVEGDRSLFAIDDFNGDGVPDLAFGTSSREWVGIHLGDGKGTFSRVADPVSPPFTSTRVVLSFASGDLDGDGRLDLIGVDGRPNASPPNPTSWFALLGQGDGTFQRGEGLPEIPEPIAVAAGDIDGDGDLDLVVVGNLPLDGRNGFFGAHVYVLRNTGDGMLTPEGPYEGAPNSFRGSPDSFFLRDLDGDGSLDVLFAISNGPVVVLTNFGDGQFLASELVDDVWSKAALGDLDGDGILDLVGLSPTEQGLAVLLGFGDGTFVPIPDLPLRGRFALGDVNGDGDLDLVAEDFGGFSVYHGFGDSTFEPAGVGFGVSPQELHDFDGDGALDLLGARGSAVAVLKGDGDASFASPVTQQLEGNPGFALARDFDRDGTLDLAISHYAFGANEGAISILLGGGDGAFLETARIEEVTFGSLVAVDLNTDGLPELVAAGIQTFHNSGGGRFSRGESHLEGEASLFYGTVGDLNGDALADILAFVQRGGGDLWAIALLVNRGGGRFFGPYVEPFTESTSPGKILSQGGPRPLSAALGDLDNDGDLDLVVTREKRSTQVLLNAGDGSFEEPVALEFGRDPQFVALGDLNGDGNLDAAITFGTFPVDETSVAVHLGLGDGTLGPATDLRLSGGASPSLYVAMDDMDGDGVLDLVAGLRFSEIAVLRGLGDGSFSREENYPVVAVGDGHQMALGDFDSDGDVDVVLPVFRQGLTFLPNQSVR